MAMETANPNPKRLPSPFRPILSNPPTQTTQSVGTAAPLETSPPTQPVEIAAPLEKSPPTQPVETATSPQPSPSQPSPLTRPVKTAESAIKSPPAKSAIETSPPAKVECFGKDFIAVESLLVAQEINQLTRALNHDTWHLDIDTLHEIRGVDNEVDIPSLWCSA